MEAADCSWNLVFKSADETEELTFQINGKEPPTPVVVEWDMTVVNLEFTVGQWLAINPSDPNWVF
jgi:hypothetical protein